MPINPTSEQIAALSAVAGTETDGPLVMLNLNRYREHAAYDSEPPGGESPDVSGREAYARYGVAAQAMLERVGGKILWYAQSDSTVIGDESDRYDEVLAVWYPSRAAFLSLATAPEILAALPHRVAALDRASIVVCEAGPEPVLNGA